MRHLLADCWQTTLRGWAGDALCLVELRGFEPLTPCMPSRDPRHSVHQESSLSRASTKVRRSSAWWFVWVRRAELLRGCCAKRRSLRVYRGELRWGRSAATTNTSSLIASRVEHSQLACRYRRSFWVVRLCSPLKHRSSLLNPSLLEVEPAEVDSHLGPDVVVT